MKVWTYYAHPSKVFPNDEDAQAAAAEYGSDTDILYAMTSNKDHAKVFKRTRNMDIFHEIVLDDLTDEEWSRLLGENRDCYLEYRKIMTRKTAKNKVYPEECVFVNVLLTFAEIIDIEDNSDMQSIVVNKFANDASPLGILDVPILKELFKLHYWDIINIIGLSEYDVGTEICPWTTMDHSLITMVDEIHHTAKIDQLEYFIINYGHTLAIE